MGIYRYLRVLPFMLISLQSVNVFAHQSSLQHGLVFMNGSIFDTPCAVDVADQTVHLLTNASGKSRSAGHPFALHFNDCRPVSAGEGKTTTTLFQVIFEGNPAGHLFVLAGTSGIAMEIADNAGNVAIPGRPMPDERANSDQLELDYVLRLIGDSSRLKTGENSTAIRFKADYF